MAPGPGVVQESPWGTGDAVKAARATLEGFEGRVLVLFGDTPFITPGTLEAVAGAVNGAAECDIAVAVLGFCPTDPGEYGRLKLGDGGRLEAIVEYRDATEEERAIGLCNSGVMAISGAHLFSLLDRATNDNARGQIYPTAVVALARAGGHPTSYKFHLTPPWQGRVKRGGQPSPSGKGETPSDRNGSKEWPKGLFDRASSPRSTT